MKTRKAIYPGSFDPLTFGHIDIAERALKIFDTLLILVAQNTQKQPMFTIDERIGFLKNHFKGHPQIEIASLHGLLVTYMEENHYKTCVRGLRVLSDFEYEFQMAMTNKQLFHSFEVIFLLCDMKYANISSTLVKDIIRFDGKMDKYIPKSVLDVIKKKKESCHEF